MQRGHSKSDTVRTARVFSLPGLRSPDRGREGVSLKTRPHGHGIRDRRRSDARTSAAPVLLPHHHLLVLFSGGQEGDGLAEAEAALASRVLSGAGALAAVGE